MSGFEVFVMVGGWVAAAVVFTVGVMQWMAERHEARRAQDADHQHERKLADASARADVTREVLGAALAAISAGHSTLLDQRAAAIRTLWNAIYEVKGMYRSATFFYDITVPADYADILAEGRQLGALIKSLTDEPPARFDELDAEVFAARPFLSPRLWVLWWLHRALHARVNHILVAGAKGGRIVHWTDDPVASKQLLSVLFTGEELLALAARHKDVGLLAAVVTEIETQILNEAHRLLTGRDLAESGATDARRLAERFVDGQVALARVEAQEGGAALQARAGASATVGNPPSASNRDS